MTNWKNRLRGDPLPWLLEPDNPCVRHSALTGLLDYAPKDEDVRAARQAIPNSRWVKDINADRRRNGGWPGEDFYLPKGRGTFWRLCLLGELGLCLPDDCDRVLGACEFMFCHQDEDGSFRRARKDDGRLVFVQEAEPCTQARMVRALIQLGYRDDPRTKRAIAWMVHKQREDGAWLCERRDQRRGCLRATIDYLRAVELFPAMQKEPATARAVRFVSALLLEPGMGRYHVGDTWTVLEFPYFGYSLIPTLLALLHVGADPDEPAMRRGLDYMIERQRPDGTWALDAAPRAPTGFGRIGEPNKWLTLDALRVLRAAYA